MLGPKRSMASPSTVSRTRHFDMRGATGSLNGYRSDQRGSPIWDVEPAASPFLLATIGYHVTASDISPKMVERARRKANAADMAIDLAVSDASSPELSTQSVDVVLIRHLAWPLPDPRAAIDRWVALFGPSGRLVMVEGHWGVPGSDGKGDSDEGCHGDDGPLQSALPWYGGVDAQTLMAVLQELAFRRTSRTAFSGM